MRLPLSVYRSRIGVQWADPSVRPSCVVTPRYSRWFMDGRFAPLSRLRKDWDSKMYPQTLSRHESERAPLGLSRSWRGGRGGVCNTPLRIRQEEVSRRRLSRPRKGWDSKMYPLTLSRHESERATLWLSRPWRGGLGGVCNTPLHIRQEERVTLGLSRPRKGWESKMYPQTLSRHESERAALGLSCPRKGWDSKMYPQTLSRHESERATLGLSRFWRGGLEGVCNTPLPCWKEEGEPLWPSRPRKEWDSKMYPLTLSRHESGRATLGLSRPWRGGRRADIFAPLPIRQEERAALELSHPWRVGLGGVCNTPLRIRQEERASLGLSRPWRGGRGADIFATCTYSFLVTITPRLTFHF